MSKYQEEINSQGFIRFCESMGINPSDLADSSHLSTEKTPESFSLSKLKALRDHVNIPPESSTCSTLEECTKVIQEWVEHAENRVVCTTNFQTMMEIHRNENFTKLFLESVDLMTTQSLTVGWTLRKIGINSLERVETWQIFYKLCQYCYQHQKKVFLISNQSNILETVKKNLVNEFSDIDLVGSEYLPLQNEIDFNAEIVQKINESEANLVIVSLPNPQQEIWLVKHHKEINAVLFGVGKTFPYYEGPGPQTVLFLQWPKLIQIYYLLTKPQELGRYYLPKIPAFIWLILKTQINGLHKNCSFRVSGGIGRVTKFLNSLYVVYQ